MPESSMSAAAQERGAPSLTIEMCGPNLVIRSTAALDEAFTAALVDAANAASATNTVIIIDPEPVRCDDTFAARAHPTASAPCLDHDNCVPVEVEVLNSRMIRIAAERDAWTVDLRTGRFCQVAASQDIRHLSPESWMSVIAIILSPRRMTALTVDGNLITSNRAHRATAA